MKTPPSKLCLKTTIIVIHSSSRSAKKTNSQTVTFWLSLLVVWSQPLPIIILKNKREAVCPHLP